MTAAPGVTIHPAADRSEIIVLLDRSGSMAAIREDMEGGFDSFIQKQRELPGEFGVTLVQFDSEGIETLYESLPVQDVPNLQLDPRGTTPLLDAMGQTISRSIARKVAGRVVFLVITDGQENASHEFTKQQIKTLVNQQTAASWTFSFLGANVDAFAEAGSLGILASASAPFVADSAGVASAFGMVSESVRQYRGGSPYKLKKK